MALLKNFDFSHSIIFPWEVLAEKCRDSSNQIGFLAQGHLYNHRAKDFLPILWNLGQIFDE